MIKVLIVDDSAVARQMLSDLLSRASDIEIVGTAANPLVAREKIKRYQPDVLTLDVEMPHMDGLTFLSNLMRLRPMPVVMISALTEQGAETTLRALELGAVDFISKPRLDLAASGFNAYAEQVIAKVRLAAVARLRLPLEALLPQRAVQKTPLPNRLAAGVSRFYTQVIGIGASTGGTEAIREVIAALPANMPSILISQHIPSAFSGQFARRVDAASTLNVCEAQDGQLVLSGHVYIAPGDRHLRLERDNGRYLCRLDDGLPVNRHRPSVDVMFHSLAELAGAQAVGVMLTGMGADGAEGLGAMRRAGARTLAQDEKTSVVWGMPGEAVRRGFVDEVLPLDKIARRLEEIACQGSNRFL